jgi:3-hydroxyacyl-[acyl-carrier-protein] dehydratase
MMDIREILATLPHRFPIILVDRVLELEHGKRIVAIKNVTANEPVFSGHFPHYPVMPGVLILESMAQAAAILSIISAGYKGQSEGLYYFAGIDKARFKRPVIPGDQLRLEVDLDREMRGVGKFRARALVDGQLACEAELMCAYRAIVADTVAQPAVVATAGPAEVPGAAGGASGAT